MKKINSKMFVLPLIIAGFALSSVDAKKHQEPAQDKTFSFVAFGDSRPLMYLPFDKSQDAKVREYYVDMLKLGGFKDPEKLVKKMPIKYEKKSGDLVSIKMPYVANSTMEMDFDKGWVTKSFVTGTDGKTMTSYRAEGGSWVAYDVADKVASGQADFVIHSGDIVWWGKQGKTLKESPYWQKVDRELLSKLPEPTEEMKKANMYGRYFPAIGNHEVWDDPDGVGVRSTLPYLSKLGVTKDNFIYKFDYRNARFISLYTGPYDYTEPSEWEGKKPVAAVQEKQLKKWLDEAKADPKITNVFVSMHNPVFASSSEFGGMPEDHNPHKLLASYAKDLNIAVFNGHIHTTEVREVDGVKYMLLGGGGGEQVYEVSKKLPADYPKELYWGDKPRVEEYNYVIVTVDKEGNTAYKLKRFRPETADPFESVILYPDEK